MILISMLTWTGLGLAAIVAAYLMAKVVAFGVMRGIEVFHEHSARKKARRRKRDILL